MGVMQMTTAAEFADKAKWHWRSDGQRRACSYNGKVANFENTAEQYANAVAAERAAWLAVQDRLPSTPTYSPELWEQWRQAAAQVDASRRRLLQVVVKASD